METSMPPFLTRTRPEIGPTVGELRRRLGLFSFQAVSPALAPSPTHGPSPDLEIGSGAIVEWLVAGRGSGAFSAALRLVAQIQRGGLWALVDPAGECYPPALIGWGIDPRNLLVIQPRSARESAWAIEQCLLSPAVATTWAWLDRRFSERVHRRWQIAAEKGGGMGMLFRPAADRREPVWADLRLLITPLAGGEGENRRLRVETLYRRGGLGARPQAWEIDHASGDVRLVSEMAHSTNTPREARA